MEDRVSKSTTNIYLILLFHEKLRRALPPLAFPPPIFNLYLLSLHRQFLGILCGAANTPHKLKNCCYTLMEGCWHGRNRNVVVDREKKSNSRVRRREQRDSTASGISSHCTSPQQRKKRGWRALLGMGKGFLYLAVVTHQQKKGIGTGRVTLPGSHARSNVREKGNGETVSKRAE